MTDQQTFPATSRTPLDDPPASERSRLASGGVACWVDDLVIDTYEPAEPDRYPMFLDRRVYQGSSGRVYPIPFVDRIATEKAPRAWRAIHLENAWVRLVLLPELGGRIHVGHDKTRGYDFFYRNNVIKPALVGLAGPWVSGGVEFNWPQHHRPATFLPVETHVERHDDGSVTVWHSDLDPLQRMRARHGIRLRPDSTLVELDVVLHNRTDLPQTFLWWANVAARAHERYQSFFPTDVRYVADHARRAVTAFPRADRPYYGVDYPTLAADRPDADRVDIYANIPVPTSYMVTDTADNFFGGYDHDARAGFVHWADRGISPGKKQWTWGNGPLGHAWDRHLTDTDGPYVELMAGVFTDNQPDFTWLAPGETRRFAQYWYPIQDIGPAVQATRDAAVAVSVAAGRCRVGVATTSPHRDARITVRDVAGDTVATWRADIAPGEPFVREAATGLGSRDDLVVVATTADGRELVDWRAHATDTGEPWVATEPPAPADVASVDELYLTGLHLEQYRHPTRSPEPYYAEALRRDAGDSRVRVALARRCFGRGHYRDALSHLDVAVDRLTRRNLNPERGDAFLLRGLVAERLGDDHTAADAFAKAGWDGALALPAALGRCRAALRAGDVAAALTFAADARRAAPESPQAVAAAVIAHRQAGHGQDAAEPLRAARAADPLDPLLAALDDDLDPRDPRTLLEIAHELFRAGDGERGLRLAERASQATAGPFGNPAPTAAYARAMMLDRDGHHREAAAERARAASLDATLCFPHGLGDHDALTAAVAADPTDGRALALLGSWLLDVGRVAEAADTLDAALGRGVADPVVWRNAAVAVVNAGGDPAQADRHYAEALRLAPHDPRLVYERDQLAALRGVDAARRLTMVERAGPDVLVRDDLAVGYAHLLIDRDRAEDALELLLSRPFQPFEGGEGQVLRAFDRAQVRIARALLDREPDRAARMLAEGLQPPPSLGEGRHPGDPAAERLVALGDALAAAGRATEAADAWCRARAATPLAVARRPAAEDDYWVGVAHVRLGEREEARGVFARLATRAEEIEARADRVDYFATSLPELLLFSVDSPARRSRHAAELRDLAHRGHTLLEEQ